MECPILKSPPSTREMIRAFGGYNRSPRIGDGEFRHMENLTADRYPVLSPRMPRQLYMEATAPAALAWKNTLCYLAQDPGSDPEDFAVIWVGKARIDLPVYGHREQQPVDMGAYYIAMPSGVWCNTAFYDPETGTFSGGKNRSGQINAQWMLSANGTVQCSPCREDGTLYTQEELPITRPSKPRNGQLWLDESVPVIRRWQAEVDGGMWVEEPSTYVRLEAPGIGRLFSRMDGVTLSELPAPLDHLNGSNMVWHAENNVLVVQGLITGSCTVESAQVDRAMPEMDFVIECGNRLWGCRYGKNARGEFVNEIYCSKLGDFKNWNSFMGISTDSAVISLGSDGPFTGAVSYMGHPIFFKEHVLHKVHISATGAHSVTDTPCPGVQSGCAKSLAVVGDTLFYKSRNSIVAYDGSLPVQLSDVFGPDRYDSAVAGGHGDKYYISMRDPEDRWHLFVYDTRRRLWHREDGLQVTQFVSDAEYLYGVVGNEIWILSGSQNPTEGPVEWSAETGPMELTSPDRSYLTRLNVQLSMEQGTEVSLYVRYDESPRWEHLHTVIGKGLGCVDIPVRPKRCDHMYLRITGRGPAQVYAFTKTVEQGSDRL